MTSLFAQVFIVLHCCIGIHCALLRVGNPLTWTKSKPFLDDVRKSGVSQFLSHYKCCKGLRLSQFLWGDELEYGIFKYTTKKRKRFSLSLSGAKMRNKLSIVEKQTADDELGCEWQPEYGSWMIEAVPRNPFGGQISDLINVEKSMRLRRRRLHQLLSADEIAPSVVTFPMMGVHNEDATTLSVGPISNSQYLRDNLINPHPRFAALTRNIRERRGSNVDIRVKKDVQSCPNTTCLNTLPTTTVNGDNLTHLHMDAMAFGMGCCCLQVTMQCEDEPQSRYLHDQLTVMAPLLHALSAATPILKGHLVATDTRWEVISQAVDDRTVGERGEDKAVGDDGEKIDAQLAGGGVRRINKSRYSTVSSFIGQPTSSSQLAALQALNDVEVPHDEEVFDRLVAEGVDPILALHVAHLFIRDPLVIFDDAIHLNDSESLDHFDNIQSTNWRSMRWKPPSLQVGMEHNRRTQIELNQRNDDSVKTADQISTSQNQFHCRHNILCSDHRVFFVDSEEDEAYQGVGSGANSHNTVVASVAEAAPNSPTGDLTSSHVTSCSVNVSEDLQSHGPGWRVEFRPLEIQLTDFENAAYAVFVVLLSRCLLDRSEGRGRLNLYLPMSFVEENMRRAVLKDAVNTQKFYFPRNAFRPRRPEQSGIVGTDRFAVPNVEDIDVVEMTLHEIVNGQHASSAHSCDLFPGLIPIVTEYTRSLCRSGTGDDLRSLSQLQSYFALLSRRAEGSLPTAARWMRRFVTSHADYKQDGVVSHQINTDLLNLCEEVGMERVSAEDLVGGRRTHEEPQEELQKLSSSVFLQPVRSGNMLHRGLKWLKRELKGSERHVAAQL